MAGLSFKISSMKLYATVSSERASKGQGGENLTIEICGPTKEIVATLEVEWNGEKVIIEGTYNSYQANMYASKEEDKKGNKQEGEECRTCIIHGQVWCRLHNK